MTATRTIDAAVRQFDVIWSFAELHLDALVEDDFHWRPAELTWTVHRDGDGVWRPDWSDTEPDPIPVPTTAWLTWQVIWWWSTALDELSGVPHRPREDVTWPGTGAAAVSEIRSLASRWRAALSHLRDEDLGVPTAFPWVDDPSRTLEDTVLWVNVELMKNMSEIGQLRLLRAARVP